MLVVTLLCLQLGALPFVPDPAESIDSTISGNGPSENPMFMELLELESKLGVTTQGGSRYWLGVEQRRLRDTEVATKYFSKAPSTRALPSRFFEMF